MNKFIVVDVITDYSYVENVELRASFSSKEEAENYIQQEKDKYEASWEARFKYASDYVDSLVVPENETLESYLRNKYNYQYYSSHGEQLLEQFKNILSGYSYYGLTNLEDYNPPMTECVGNLFILEVKDE